jgi:methanogenic corrinoid protein MtbC1
MDNDFREAKAGRLGRAFAAALLSGDEVGAEVAVREAMDARLSAAEIDDEIIAPALWLVGELWERGEISIADEHIATEIAVRVLTLQREARRVAAARGGQRVMLAAPTGELHVVALKMIDVLLRDAGYRVLMLGANVPAHALADSAARHEPAAVCLTATMPGAADLVLISIHEIQQEWGGAGFVVGGRDVAPRLRSRPGISVCRRVSEVVESVDAMVQRAEMN